MATYQELLTAAQSDDLKQKSGADEAARMARIMAIERRREEEILILLLALA